MVFAGSLDVRRRVRSSRRAVGPVGKVVVRFAGAVGVAFLSGLFEGALEEAMMVLRVCTVHNLYVLCFQFAVLFASSLV